MSKLALLALLALLFAFPSQASEFVDTVHGGDFRTYGNYCDIHFEASDFEQILYSISIDKLEEPCNQAGYMVEIQFEDCEDNYCHFELGDRSNQSRGTYTLLNGDEFILRWANFQYGKMVPGTEITLFYSRD